MAFPDRPNDTVGWAEDGASLIDEPSTERTRGFPFGYFPTSSQINWLYRAIMRWISYFRGSGGGGFDDLDELIDTLEVGECATLATPQLQPGEILGRLDIPREIFAIATDGDSIYFVEENGIGRYEVDTGLTFGPSPLPYIDTTFKVYLDVNGSDVVVGYTTDDATAKGVVRAYDASLALSWSQIYSSGSTILISGLVISGTAVYLSFAEGTDRFVDKRAISDGTLGPTFSKANIAVKATNGRYVAFSVGAGTVEIRDADLVFIDDDTHGATGAAANMAMDDRKLYVLTGDDDLLSYGITPNVLFNPQELSKPAWGTLAVDDDQVLFSENNTANVIGGNKSDGGIYALWSFFIDDLDATSQGYFASDSHRIYIAGETTTPGDYSIWILAKGQAPKIWRRLDPGDNDAWPRTLAAPI